MNAIARVGRIPGLRAAVAAMFTAPDAEPVELGYLLTASAYGIAYAAAITALSVAILSRRDFV